MAIQALSFIAADPERLGRFLAATGIGPGDIRAAAREPLFLAGVLDHITGDETLLVGLRGRRRNPIRATSSAPKARLSGRRYERDLP